MQKSIYIVSIYMPMLKYILKFNDIKDWKTFSGKKKEENDDIHQIKNHNDLNFYTLPELCICRGILGFLLNH